MTRNAGLHVDRGRPGVHLPLGCRALAAPPARAPPGDDRAPRGGAGDRDDAGSATGPGHARQGTAPPQRTRRGQPRREPGNPRQPGPQKGNPPPHEAPGSHPALRPAGPTGPRRRPGSPAPYGAAGQPGQAPAISIRRRIRLPLGFEEPLSQLPDVHSLQARASSASRRRSASRMARCSMRVRRKHPCSRTHRQTRARCSAATWSPGPSRERVARRGNDPPVEVERPSAQGRRPDVLPHRVKQLGESSESSSTIRAAARAVAALEELPDLDEVQHGLVALKVSDEGQCVEKVRRGKGGHKVPSPRRTSRTLIRLNAVTASASCCGTCPNSAARSCSRKPIAGLEPRRRSCP